jgi:hypothetical protein
METAFHFDPKQKHLSFLLKENVTSDPDIQLRLRGRLNTVTGGLEYHATAQKFVSTSTAVKVWQSPEALADLHLSIPNAALLVTENYQACMNQSGKHHNSSSS